MRNRTSLLQHNLNWFWSILRYIRRRFLQAVFIAAAAGAAVICTIYFLIDQALS